MYPRHHGRTLLGGKLFGRSAHTARMKATSNAARRDASAARVAHLFPDGPLGVSWPMRRCGCVATRRSLVRGRNTLHAQESSQPMRYGSTVFVERLRFRRNPFLAHINLPRPIVRSTAGRPPVVEGGVKMRVSGITTSGNAVARPRQRRPAIRDVIGRRVALPLRASRFGRCVP